MKKRLLFQSAAALAVAMVITYLAAICVLSGMARISFLPVKQGYVSSKVIVFKNGEATYSSDNFSPYELTSIYLSAMEQNPVYKYKKISYRIERQSFPDGTEIISLNPRIGFSGAIICLAVFFSVVLWSVYLLAAWFFRRTNEREIIKPLNNLIRLTGLMHSGSLDVSIPDEGCDEIRELCTAVEDLRLRLKDEVYRNRTSDEERRFLISSVSHDLRTPVTSIRGYLEGILDGVADTDEKRRLYIQKSLEKTELINHMIGDLLLYSKLNSNQIEFRYQTINISEYLAAFVADSRPVFAGEEKQISFTSTLSSDCCVRADVQQLDRVMHNIAENAMKYIQRKVGHVEVILRQNISSIIIEVKDNGSGIDKKDLTKIFDRFYRCESARAIKGSSGLGLAISKQIIESMGGRIWAISQPGEGTSLIISLRKEHKPKSAVPDADKKCGE